MATSMEKDIHQVCQYLYPYNRSFTRDGIHSILKLLQMCEQWQGWNMYFK